MADAVKNTQTIKQSNNQAIKLCLMGLGEKGFKVLGEECFSVLLYAVDKLISLYGSHHINISTYQHINP